MPHDIRFQTSFNCIVSGMSSSGKTTWVKNLLALRKQLFTKVPAKTFLFYKVMQDIYLEMENTGLVDELINVNEQLPSLDEITEMVHKYKDQGGSLLIFDDTMSSISEDFEQLFCNLSHHENMSIIFLTQNFAYLIYINNTINKKYIFINFLTSMAIQH